MEKQRLGEIVYRGLTKLQVKRLCIGVLCGIVGVIFCLGMDLPRHGYNWFCNVIYVIITAIGYGVGTTIFKK